MWIEISNTVFKTVTIDTLFQEYISIRAITNAKNMVCSK
jgi:hypothetical protein